MGLSERRACGLIGLARGVELAFITPSRTLDNSSHRACCSAKEKALAVTDVIRSGCDEIPGIHRKAPNPIPL